MAQILSAPFTLTNQSRAFTTDIADNITLVRAAVPQWTGTGTVRLDGALSFDSGVTWLPAGAVGATARGAVTYKGRNALWLEVIPWKMCRCGQPFTPLHPANGSLLVHSTHAFRRGETIGRLGEVTFHNPDDTPAAGPLRQVRITLTAAGATVSSTFTVDVL